MNKILDKKVKNVVPKLGEIWLVKCDKIKEFSKDYRPALIISNDIQNEFDDFVTVAMMTTEDIENVQLFEVFIKNTSETGLKEPSKISFSRLFTVFKLRLDKHLGVANREIMEKAKEAWKIAFDVEEW
jgi:mRNA-degrading endonuclease toxin of MazEF toxin-antitoxin module